MHFIKQRKWFYIFSLLIIIPGIASMLINGFNPGIDFTGGSSLHYQINANLGATEVQEVVKSVYTDKEPTVQKSEDEFFIRTAELDQEQTAAITAALTEQYPETVFLAADVVGAIIGGELKMNAIYAILIAVVLMLAYISFRFEWTFGVAAVMALLHDVLIVMSLYSFFQWEINSAFIAALLTILGYSINDTIVIFDRVRENFKMRKRDPLDDMLHKSVLQTITRSVNTVMTVLLPLIMLLMFGGETLKGLVLTLLIGFLFGMYSSICVASPLYYEIKTRADSRA